MSELTSCNYCTFESMKRHAKEKKEKLVKKPNIKESGVDILVDGEFRCWFMELTSYCCC